MGLRIRIGGTVGKVLQQGGDALKDGAKATANLGKATVDAATAPASQAIDVLHGKSLDQAVRDSIAKQTTGVPVAAADAVAAMHDAAQSIATSIVEGALGHHAADLLNDTLKLIEPLGPDAVAAVAGSLQEFIKTGDVNALNPVAILAAAEIAAARNQLYPRATPIPDAVRTALPAEVIRGCDHVRVIEKVMVPGDLNLPKMAISHFNKVPAITLIDVIIFEAIPSAANDHDLGVWTHELCHVHQYANKGVIKFAKEYIAAQTGFHPQDWVANALEVEADMYQCTYYPDSDPAYIGVCPVRKPRAKQ